MPKGGSSKKRKGEQVATCSIGAVEAGKSRFLRLLGFPAETVTDIKFKHSASCLDF